MNADAVRLVYEGESLMVAADAVRFVPNAISGAAYVHGDHLGTPAKMTGDAGTVIRDAAYKPFGGEASVVGSENLDLRFPGQIQDLESGRSLASLVMPLHYNYFRDYDPASGRYLQVDPIGLAGGLNTYGYAQQNPNIFVDPMGIAEHPKKARPSTVQKHQKSRAAEKRSQGGEKGDDRRDYNGKGSKKQRQRIPNN
jgi:RHS repeat-associated protein